MKSISVLGSTGSIGCNTLKVIEHLKKEFRIAALAAGNNTKLLAEQIKQFQPETVAVKDDKCAEELLRIIQDSKSGVRKMPKVFTGEDGLIKVATNEQAEIVVSATVGAVGFVPTLKAIEAGKRIALANKETLVMAGDLIIKAAEKHNAEILPVDSEHNALHQCLRGEKLSEVKRLILTASGGPFRTKTKAEIENATVKEALNHPNWKMGDKITIDSATLMNKGLEIIEAHHLFAFDAERISVVVHPQSVVHSMIEMIDGSIVAQLGVTDMKHAIQYALTYPERQKNCLKPLDFTKISQLDFEEPDFERFPCLSLAYEALRKGGTMPAVLNAANEIAVQAFLDGKIKLSDIPEIIETVMSEHETKTVLNLESVSKADESARKRAIIKIEEIALAN